MCGRAARRLVAETHGEEPEGRQNAAGFVGFLSVRACVVRLRRDCVLVASVERGAGVEPGTRARPDVPALDLTFRTLPADPFDDRHWVRRF